MPKKIRNSAYFGFIDKDGLQDDRVTVSVFEHGHMEYKYGINPGAAFKKHSYIEWHYADGATLGRLATQVAMILRGKNKPTWTPNMDCGDHVIIINADKVALTGKKWTDRVYLSYTGYPGGQRECTPAIMKLKAENKHIRPGMNPLFIKVMKGMLPKNRLGRRLIENMHVYNGSEHPHAAQNPKVIDINKLK